MVERVEGFAKEEEWKRSFQEINEFESQLKRFGTIIIKFWIHLSQEEQLKRFNDRKANPFKKWKITEEDWRNRDQWNAYTIALEEMFQKTSTFIAPWKIIEGNNKYYARIKAMDTIIDTLKKHPAIQESSEN